MTFELLTNHKIAYDEIAHGFLKEWTAKEAAQVTNLPLAYIGITLLVKAGERVVAAVHSGDAALDLAALAKVAGAETATILPHEQAEQLAGQPAGRLNPLTLPGHFEVWWDERCLLLPTLCLPGADAEHSLRLDTRHLWRLPLKRASLIRSRPPAASAYEVLLERGFIDRVTDEDKAREYLGHKSVSTYVGFDPTADSLHVGSLLPIMALANLQRFGLPTIAIVGGATGMIGDPSGKTELRSMLTRDHIRRNMDGISRQLSAYLAIDGEQGRLIDNSDWFAQVSCLEFLRELGPHFSIKMMLNKECFKSRMEREGEGLTYLELTYMLMQAYDFVHLAEQHNCLVQMGGSDQWGNICAGAELGRKVQGGTMFARPIRRSGNLVGVTFTLLRKASGGKFGKTESGNLWLDEARTSAYDFFQFWRNTDDTDVARFLAVFTFLPLADIRPLCASQETEALNTAKEVLAFAATALAHGKAKAVAAVKSSRSLFGGYGPAFQQALVRLGLAEEGDLGALRESAVDKDVKHVTLPAAEVNGGRLTVVELLVRLALAKSKSEARRLIGQGGAYVNDQRIDSDNAVLPDDKPGATFTVRAGKKKYGILYLN